MCVPALCGAACPKRKMHHRRRTPDLRFLCLKMESAVFLGVVSRNTLHPQHRRLDKRSAAPSESTLQHTHKYILSWCSNIAVFEEFTRTKSRLMWLQWQIRSHPMCVLYWSIIGCWNGDTLMKVFILDVWSMLICTAQFGQTHLLDRESFVQTVDFLHWVMRFF